MEQSKTKLVLLNSEGRCLSNELALEESWVCGGDDDGDDDVIVVVF
jgi:hypothetical protein